jgi:hypothetical protein
MTKSNKGLLKPYIYNSKKIYFTANLQNMYFSEAVFLQYYGLFIYTENNTERTEKECSTFMNILKNIKRIPIF